MNTKCRCNLKKRMNKKYHVWGIGGLSLWMDDNSGIALLDPVIMEDDVFCRKFKPPEYAWESAYQIHRYKMEDAYVRFPNIPNLYVSDGEGIFTMDKRYAEHLNLLGWWEEFNNVLPLEHDFDKHLLGVCTDGVYKGVTAEYIKKAGEVYDAELARGDAYPSEIAQAAWDIRKGTRMWAFKENILGHLVHALWSGDHNRSMNSRHSVVSFLKMEKEEAEVLALAKLSHIQGRDFKALLS